tara:strand:- start:142 stop:522 length:381 start_codon:yes stop_codon:yes gene_type:complete
MNKKLIELLSSKDSNNVKLGVILANSQNYRIDEIIKYFTRHATEWTTGHGKFVRTSGYCYLIGEYRLIISYPDRKYKNRSFICYTDFVSESNVTIKIDSFEFNPKDVQNIVKSRLCKIVKLILYGN